MTPEQFTRVREIFESALEAEPADLRGWLEVHAGDDPQVRQEVDALLQINSRAGAFLSDAVADRVPDLLAGDALEPGTTIGNYTIERDLGGNLGRVYRATDTRLNRSVAIKMLPPLLARDPARRERLRREAQALAALKHPGICTVYALEESDGDLFIVSEYIEGRTLREEINRGVRPSPAAILETARELAEALASAHEKKITHRDLKPENVMRTAKGRLKILDFGLARFEQPLDRARANMTEPGTVVGTPAYMAPEQLSGQPVDVRADVFAFGVLLYEYACGVHPFEDATAIEIAARVLQTEAPAIKDRCPEIPMEVARVVEKCLRKLPPERFASAAEIVVALAPTGTARPPEPPGPSDPTEPGDRDDRDHSNDPRPVTVWWRRHQGAVIGLYLLASGFAWQIKEWLHGVSDPVFLLIGVVATIGGLFRGHLMFTERMNVSAFPAERKRSRPVTLAVDIAVAVLLVIDGVLIESPKPVVASLTFALALVLALLSVVIEPRTAEAAFRRQRIAS